MANAIHSTTVNHLASEKRCSSVVRVGAVLLTIVTPLCRASSVGNCGAVTVATFHHSIGWVPFVMTKIETFGNGLVVKRLPCHSGIYLAAMKIVHDSMDRRDGCGAIPIAIRH